MKITVKIKFEKQKPYGCFSFHVEANGLKYSSLNLYSALKSCQVPTEYLEKAVDVICEHNWLNAEPFEFNI